MADLSKRVGEDIPMNQFRPNLVTCGGAPWEEDTWEAFQIGGAGQKALEFAGVKPCSRCKVGCLYTPRGADKAPHPQGSVDSAFANYGD